MSTARDDEAARRARTLVMLDASRAALDACESSIVQDFARVRRMLAEIEAWAQGGAAPALMARYPVLRAAVLGDARATAAIEAEWESACCFDWHISDAAASCALDVATGVELDVDHEIGTLRQYLDDMVSSLPTATAERIWATFDRVAGTRPPADKVIDMAAYRKRRAAAAS